MTGLGHEHQFPPPRLSGRCRFSQRTFAERGATGEKRKLKAKLRRLRAGKGG